MWSSDSNEITRFSLPGIWKSEIRPPLLALELEVIKSQSWAAVLGSVHREAKAANLLREKKEAGAERKVKVSPPWPWRHRLSDLSPWGFSVLGPNPPEPGWPSCPWIL